MFQHIFFRLCSSDLKLFTVSTGPKSHFCVLGFKLNWFPRIVDKDKDLFELGLCLNDEVCVEADNAQERMRTDNVSQVLNLMLSVVMTV